MTTVGRVVELRRFPVKSMAGEQLDTVDLHWTGIAGDRQYAFVRSADRSHFPWMTVRQSARMLRHRARYEGRPSRQAIVQVTAPDAAIYDVTDPALAAIVAELAAGPVHLMRMERGCFDAMPLSLLTTGEVAAIGQAHGAALDPRRFRANILVESEGDARDWIGCVLAIGDARVRADWAIPRCAIITVDPHTAERDAGVLRTVAQRFGNTAGIYATAVEPGVIRLGDLVNLA